MKTKIYFGLLIIATVFLIYSFDLNLIELKPMADIDLSTLLVTFPIILALVERFNELFVIKKKTGVAADETELAKIAKKNFSFSFFTSLTLGILLALAGFRILETFMVPPATAPDFQNILFKLLDCVLTASIIAGGTDGWHQIVSLISDITKAKRKEIKENVK
ncbi:MAG: hypothetical protein ACR2MT_00755 [Aurantibacter sp.]